MPINYAPNHQAGGTGRELSQQPVEAARPYWSYQRLAQSNQLQTREVAEAQAFLLNFLKLPEPFSDRSLQQQLVWQTQLDDPELARLALGCLRCFISHQIPQICLGLEQRFGEYSGLKQSDLYAYLLDDPDPMRDLAPYQPLALRILRQFDPNRSSLSTWTKRLVWQDKSLNQVLLNDYGIYLATDWGILLQAKPERLPQRLANQLSPADLTQFCQILACYHQIYRGDRLAQGTGGSRCTEPTAEQLRRMRVELQTSGYSLASTEPELLLDKLRQLAQHLRQLKAKPLSIEIKPIGQQIERLDDQPSEAEQSQERFLHNYRQAAQLCLRQTVDQLLVNRIAYLRRKCRRAKLLEDPAQDQAYLQAMRLFHCQCQSMSELALQVGRSGQYQVSRLLELPALQADLHQEWLLRICLELPKLLQEVFNPIQMAQLRQELDTFVNRLANAEAANAAQPAAKRAKPDAWQQQLRQLSADLPHVASLEELIDRLLRDYRAEIYSPNRTQATSQIALCICEALNSVID